jgi:hypothetical protein
LGLKSKPSSSPISGKLGPELVVNSLLNGTGNPILGSDSYKVLVVEPVLEPVPKIKPNSGLDFNN